MSPPCRPVPPLRPPPALLFGPVRQRSSALGRTHSRGTLPALLSGGSSERRSATGMAGAPTSGPSRRDSDIPHATPHGRNSAHRPDAFKFRERPRTTAGQRRHPVLCLRTVLPSIRTSLLGRAPTASSRSPPRPPDSFAGFLRQICSPDLFTRFARNHVPANNKDDEARDLMNPLIAIATRKPPSRANVRARGRGRSVESHFLAC